MGSDEPGQQPPPPPPPPPSAPATPPPPPPPPMPQGPALPPRTEPQPSFVPMPPALTTAYGGYQIPIKDPPRRSGLAVAAMICGIVGLVLCFIGILSLLALIFGLVSARQIKRGDNRLYGLRQARAGWILGIIGLVVGAVVIGFSLKEATDGTTLDDVEVGMCANVGDVDDGAVFRLDTVDCGELHDGEVIAVDPIDTSGEYPGDSEVQQLALTQCTSQSFDEYVGVTYDESEFDVLVIHPQRKQWGRGMNEIICIVYSLDGEVLTGSVRDSER